jgi:hypothetical protein
VDALPVVMSAVEVPGQQVMACAASNLQTTVVSVVAAP